MVKSSLEYACNIWPPQYETYISDLEKKKFFKTIAFKINLKKHVNLSSLSKMREILDVCLVHQIWNE